MPHIIRFCMFRSKTLEHMMQKMANENWYFCLFMSIAHIIYYILYRGLNVLFLL